jgi:GH25 family lysozyme M1 (1,4-beta-N-acetylmuramidase)
MNATPAAFTHGIDVSRYDERIYWSDLKQSGVEFAIVKVSQGNYNRDPLAESHLRGAHAAGLITGIYHWCDPLCEDTSQVEYLLQCSLGLPYRMICLDVEQFWADWSAWPRITVKAGGSRKKKKKPLYLSAERISQNAHRMAEQLRLAQPGKPVVIYTRSSFIHEHARPMLTWLGEYPLWLAQYPYLRGTPANINWSDLNMLLSGTFRPNMPTGIKAWHLWQWSGDRFNLPGISSHPDLNVFNGSLADLRQFIQPQGA